MNNSSNFESKYDKTIDIGNFFAFIVQRWVKFLVIMVAVTVIAAVYVLFIAEPSYISTAKLYIVGSNGDKINYNDLTVSTVLTRDYVEIINDSMILGEVAKKIDYKYSPSEIANAITVEPYENTRIVKIIVNTNNPEDSKKIANAICNVSKEKIIDIMGLDNIQILNKGSSPKQPDKYQMVKKFLMVCIIGFFVDLLIMLIVYSANNKISSTEDIENNLDIKVLGTIPYNGKKIK